MKVKKFLSAALVALMCVIALPIFFACSTPQGTKITTEKELKDAIATAQEEETDDELTFWLANDITIKEEDSYGSAICIKGKVTLNLNGKTITLKIENSERERSKRHGILIDDNSELTITGNGKITSEENDTSCLAVYGTDAKLTVENGTFIGCDEAVFVGEGTAIIKDGTFSALAAPLTNDYRFTLNVNDANGKNGTATIVVYGGVFKNYNPAESHSEDPAVNFVAEGYESVLVEGSETDYTVRQIQTTDNNEVVED
jgi:hypothetical protein